ncbi:hypothetical protein [Mycolicibacterium arenosum]|uniref:Uncharacterized protein n=1 Tax=Mycolicibacterium arenosum TaxID=2952157 RepID=A0ABT1LYL8_9MYCO|nr:hypothetical protein [Mycolicibacterium sp. CAU 1645]MCP9271993.1 hypothetical protein [Mycolicibacterium sp. CAU 1645]
MTCARSNLHFLAEWYWPTSTAPEFDAAVTHLIDLAEASEASVQLLVTVLVESDEVAFAVFGARSAASVAELCERAGMPAQRLTQVANTRFPSAVQVSSTSTGA